MFIRHTRALASESDALYALAFDAITECIEVVNLGSS